MNAAELKKHLEAIPDDAQIGFITDTTVLHIVAIKPDGRPKHEGAFRIVFKACTNPIPG